MINQLQPTGEQVRAFRDWKTGEPTFMQNLLKFRENAIYEDGRPSELTGLEDYQLYATAFHEIMGPKGVRAIYSGAVKRLLVGAGDDLWDSVVVIEHPSTEIMLGMLRDEDYQRTQQHRAAALKDNC